MAIDVKEIKECVSSYTRGNDGKMNATEEFKRLAKENLDKLKEVLNNDDATAKELVNSLDSLVYAILDYRYNIADYSQYSDDDKDYISHLKVSK